MRVYDAKTGQALDMPDDEAWAAYSRGQAGFLDDQEVPVVDPVSGEVQLTRGKHLRDALDAGFNPASQQQWNDAQEEYKYSSPIEQAKTALEATGSGAGYGIPNWLVARALGPEYERAASARKRINEGLYTGVELGSGLAAALATLPEGGIGGAGALGKLGLTGAREAATLGRIGKGALGLVTAPTRVVEGLGGMAERGAARLLTEAGVEGTGLMARGAKALVPALARGGVEGGLVGAGQYLTEQSLGNHEAAAEDLIISGALFGALTGGALAGAGFGAKEVKGAIARKLENAGEGGIIDGVVDLYAKASGLLSGPDADDVKKLLRDKNFRRMATENADQVYSRNVRDLSESYDSARRGFRELHQDLYGTGKATAVRKMVPQENIEAIRNEAMQLVDDLRMVHKELRSDPAIYSHRAKTKQFGELVDSLETKVLAAEGKDAGADIFLHIDEAKKKLGAIAKHEGLPGIETATADRMKRAYDELPMPFLERQDLFGMAGVAQRETNALTRPSFTSGQQMAQDYEKKFGYLDPANQWGKRSDMDLDRLENVLKRAGSPGGDQDLAALRHDAVEKLKAAEAYAKYWGVDPGVKTKLDAIADGQRKYLSDLDRAIKESTAIQTLKRVEGGVGAQTAASVLLGIGASAAMSGDESRGGMGTMAAGAALAAIKNPARMVRLLAMAERAIQHVDGQFAKRAMAMVRSGAERASRAAPTSAARLWGPDRRRREEGYKNARSEVLAMASDPSHSARAVAPFAQAAPNVAASAQAQLQRQAQFLASKLPARKPTLQPGLRDRTSDEDMARFARYYEAARKPEAVLDDLQRGKISKEGVETLQTLYPHRYETMRQQVMAHVDEMTQKGKPVPYEARIRLSAMFDIPADPSFDPGFTARVQSAYGPASASTPAPGGPLPSGTAARLRTDRYISSADSIEEGIG